MEIRIAWALLDLGSTGLLWFFAVRLGWTGLKDGLVIVGVLDWGGTDGGVRWCWIVGVAVCGVRCLW